MRLKHFKNNSTLHEHDVLFECLGNTEITSFELVRICTLDINFKWKVNKQILCTQYFGSKKCSKEKNMLEKVNI